MLPIADLPLSQRLAEMLATWQEYLYTTLYTLFEAMMFLMAVLAGDMN